MDFLLEFLLANKLYSALIFSLGFFFGYEVAQFFPKKLIDSSCNEGYKSKAISHKITKLYRGEKLVNVSCPYINASKICLKTETKCRFLTKKLSNSKCYNADKKPS